jgi:hypothetical protein
MTDSRRQQYLRRWGALKNERADWYDHWKEISEYMLPRSGRFFTTDRNKGDKRYNDIIDSTGTRALRVLAAGMMAGMTSPARPWFRLATPDPDLMEYAPVKLWLERVTELMRHAFAKSNTYRALHSVYEELGAFGTAADIIQKNYDNILHHMPLTVGEYAISTNNLGDVHTLAREFDMTVGQMVEEFGRDKLSNAVKNMYDRGAVDDWVPVIHLIQPRTARDYSRRDPLNMPYASCYLEAGGDGDDLLRESGFNRFPALCPRWHASGGDIYGNSPGMEALGDVKQLQHQQMRKGQAIDYMVKPPLQIPAALKEQQLSTLPGGTAFVDMVGPQNKIQSMFDVRLELQPLLLDIQDVRERIQKTFYADLFMMIANDQRSNITAREIAERHEEKLLMLGPVLERLHNELLKPKIDVTFDFILEAGLLRGELAPPQELQGQDLNVEFVSMLAQAQRAVGTQAVDRLVGTIGSLAMLQANSGQPVTAMDKLDVDQAIDKYADMLGIDPDLIVADDEVAIVRDNRAKMAAMQAQAQAAQQMAETAKTASEVDQESPVAQALGQFSGYSVPGTL